jgi:hypothetical protein
MIIRIALAAAMAGAVVTEARSEAPPRSATSGVGTIRVEPDVVPPLRSFRVQPEPVPAPPAASSPRPAEDLAGPFLAPAPAAQSGSEPRERRSAARRQGDGAEPLAAARRGRHPRRSEGDASDRDVAQAGRRSGRSIGLLSLSRAQREAIVAAILRDGKGVVPGAFAPLPEYPVGARVGQFSLMVSPLPAGATARLPQLGTYGYLVVHDRVLLVDPRTVTVVADLTG